MKEQAVYGLTHITMQMSTAGGATLVAAGSEVLKSDIFISGILNGTSLGTLMMAGGWTYPAGLTIGGGMMDIGSSSGLKYTVSGPAPFYLGLIGVTTTVTVMRSLSQSPGQTFKS